ncbi:hypothetical protein BLA29_009999 [Euroglyphus maynei]|uniref:Dolichyl-diphosphooligosaccharide--protein glycosyltransferase subunit 2 n=1 Tax=Euroglyphus maynei TaxID=6958 RepID=A0A1Y3B6Z3_EURMA|nr:hypothetical protein BLA29_009999 [Euroglyphus maynei]
MLVRKILGKFFCRIFLKNFKFQKHFPTITTSLIYPTTLDQLIDVDYLQRIQLKFQLKDSQPNDDVQSAVRVHQSFVRFLHLDTKQEITFVSELDSNGQHKIDINLPARSKDFNDLSGNYQLDLYLGDPLIIKAINWKIGTINLQFGQSSSAASLLNNLQRKEYLPKPEIKHLFREQDKRPPVLVSNFFTILSIVPLLGLFIAVSIRF